MEILTKIEKGQFLKLFNRSGYVLDFSTNEFDTFTMASVGIALCEEYNQSKGKSLISFIYSDNKLEKDKVKLLLDLFDYYEENYKTEYDKFSQNENVYTNKAYDPSYDILHESCKKIADRVRNVIIPNSQNIENLKNNFSSGYLSKQIDVMIKAQTDNPSEALKQ